MTAKILLMVNNGELYVGPNDDPDRYQLWRRVGAGGEGEVWQGTRQLADGPIGVAVKYYGESRFGLVEPLGELSVKLETQAARLRKLHSPGLAAVHESFLGALPHPSGQADSSQTAAYFVMDYIDGVPLSEWAQSQPSLFRRLSVMDDSAGALDALHRGGQVHADIKPSNLLVHTLDVPGSGEVPTAVLVDFGVMRAITLALPSKVIGTHGFTAPELHQGGTYSPASDLYAFAMVCAGLVCEGQTSQDIAESARVAGLPGDGIAVLLGGVDPDPEQRRSQLEHGVAGWLSQLRSGLTTTHSFAHPSTVIRPAADESAEPKPSTILRSDGPDRARAATSEPFEDPDTSPRPASDRTHRVRKVPSAPPVQSSSPAKGRRQYWRTAIAAFILVTAALAVWGVASLVDGTGGTVGAVDASDTDDTGTGDDATTTVPGDTTTSSPPDGAVDVPPLIGLSQDEAASRLRAIGLDVEINELFDDTAAGLVIATEPAAGSSVETAMTVVVVVSRGPAPSTHIEVDVAGLPLDDAVRQIVADGLIVGDVTREFDTSTGNGIVVSPPTGERFEPGASVDLVVSRGPAVIVPDLRGLSFAQATERLEEISLTVRRVEINDDDLLIGEIVGTEPPTDSTVEEGTTIDVIVSSGPADICASLEGRDRDDIEARLDISGRGFDIDLVARDDIPADTMISCTERIDGTIIVEMSTGPLLRITSAGLLANDGDDFSCTVEVQVAAGGQRVSDVRVTLEEIYYTTALGSTAGGAINQRMQGPTDVSANQIATFRHQIRDCISGFIVAYNGRLDVGNRTVDSFDGSETP